MTTVEQVQAMVNEYCRWLKDETTLKSVAKGEWVEGLGQHSSLYGGLCQSL